MDVVAQALARAIGTRVKHERRTRDWTLEQLAEQAGISRRMLVSVEQGAVNPSVGTLLRLAEALGVSLPSLVEPPAGRNSKVTRNGRGAALWSGEGGGKGVLVSSTDPPDVVELWNWTMQPGELHESEAHSDGTRELLHVLEGVLTVAAGNERFELATGDAIAFPGDVQHSYFNHGGDLTVFALTVFEPGIGANRHNGGTS